ncbi:MAG: hypothetical protein WB709_13450 [Solirubrobacteraceae bacterium]
MRARLRPHPELHAAPAETRPSLNSILRWAVTAISSVAAVLILLVGTANAATLTFGSPLAVSASKDTANDLNYQGSNVPLPGSVFHIPHDGADGALWNVQLPTGDPTAPEGGQVVSVRLEGCAKSNGPAPLTQIHFQSLAPLAGGGAKVALTSQAFDIPVCGVGGASGSTVSAYDPINLCVAQGDYVAFNEEGGFVGAQNGPPPYPAGVPYMVIGGMTGATMDSFIRNNGVGNGATFSPTDATNHDGFASNPGEELMLQATLATGPDATPICPGGTKGLPPPGSARTSHRHVFPTLTIPTPQLDGMNIRGVVQVAIYCHSASTCTGTITLHSKPHHGSHAIWLGAARFVVGAHRTGKARVHLSALARRMVRHTTGGLAVQVTGGPALGTDAFKASIAVHGA